jgi:hypothetical protein
MFSTGSAVAGIFWVSDIFFFDSISLALRQRPQARLRLRGKLPGETAAGDRTA